MPRLACFSCQTSDLSLLIASSNSDSALASTRDKSRKPWSPTKQTSWPSGSATMTTTTSAFIGVLTLIFLSFLIIYYFKKNTTYPFRVLVTLNKASKRNRRTLLPTPQFSSVMKSARPARFGHNYRRAWPDRLFETRSRLDCLHTSTSICRPWFHRSFGLSCSRIGASAPNRLRRVARHMWSFRL